MPGGVSGPFVRWLREIWEIRLYRYTAVLVDRKSVV